MIPLQCEYYALEGLADVLKTIELVRAAANPGLEVDGIVLTMFSANNLSNQVADGDPPDLQPTRCSRR